MKEKATSNNTLYLKKLIEEYGIPMKDLAKKADNTPVKNLERVLSRNIPLTREVSERLLWHAISLIPTLKFKKEDTSNLPAYSKTIKDLMVKKNMTQEQLAKKSGVSVATIYNILKGEPTKTSTLNEIGNALGYNTRVQFTRK